MLEREKCPGDKNEQDKASQGERVTNLNKVVKNGFPEKVKFGQRLGGEGVGHVAVRRTAFWAESLKGPS